MLPRIGGLVQAVAKRVNEQPATLDETLPVLVYLVERVHRLADLVIEVDRSVDATEQAIGYVESFPEVVVPPDRSETSLRVAGLCESKQYWLGAVHALNDILLNDLEGRNFEIIWSEGS